jgi:KDEL-tailed cysteine endopeptidase
MATAFDYVQENKITTEDNYPYTAYDDDCTYNNDGVVQNKGKKLVKPNSAADLIAAINVGPVSVAIEADTMTFQFYSKGVLDGAACGDDLDHGVLAVGYGTDAASGKDYFLVKNSWSTFWGDKGYIKIANNPKISGGVCGILLEAVSPTF